MPLQASTVHCTLYTSSFTVLIQHKHDLFSIHQVSALVTMYSHLGDINSAVDVLDDAVEHAQQNKVNQP